MKNKKLVLEANNATNTGRQINNGQSRMRLPKTSTGTGTTSLTNVF